jgi:hypothetical protein
MRSASEMQADLELNLLPLVTRLSEHNGAELFVQVMDRFLREGDQSQFGLGNAITSLARDTRDPSLKWDLEEFGGAVLIGTRPESPTPKGRSARLRENPLLAVG